MRRLVAVLLALAGVLSTGAAAAAAADCTTPRWIPTWSTSPTDAAAGGFQGQTLREILTPHAAGAQVRLHLSNRFGTQSVTFDHVTIGRRAAGAAVVASTLREVTFSGRRAVAVAPGEEAVSDPVALRVAPFSQLAVSVYVDAATGPATEHLIGRHRAYATPADGLDRSADPGAGDFADLDGSATFFATRLDVQAPASTGVVVAFGDSLTDGYEGSPSPLVANAEGLDADGAYPDALQRRLLAAGDPAFSIVNAGITGNRILDDGLVPVQGLSALRRLAPDALSLPGATTVIVLAGTNDIGDRSADAAQIVAGLGQLVAQGHAAGKRMLLGTLPPMLGAVSASYGDQAAEDERAQVNAWIRGGGGADGVVDFDAALRDPARPGHLSGALDSGDGLHPNLAGYRAMADAVARALLAPAPQPRAALQVRVPARYRSRLRSAVVTLDGRRVGTIRSPRGAATVDVARADHARATVRVRVALSDGRTVTSSRRLTRCTG
jgi:lysophospholipase L1-like esterase